MKSIANLCRVGFRDCDEIAEKRGELTLQKHTR